MKKDIRKLIDIENEFFEIDKENKIIKMELDYDKPDDIFDSNTKTKTPMLSDEFIEWLNAAFEYAPRKYRIDLIVKFDDLNGYTEAQLEKIFERNIGLEFKRTNRKTSMRNKIAFGLIAIGLLFLLSLILITNLWKDESVAREAFIYVFDIVTTVTIWEAMTILIVENAERNNYMRSLAKRFKKIEFLKK